MAHPAPRRAIEAARSPEDWRWVRRLFEEYAAGLGFDLAFQHFDRELASLPGEYGDPDGCVLLARRRGAPVGCVGVRPLERGVCEMKRLYVREGHRRSGLGRELALRALDEAARRGYRAMRLDTVPSMTAARRLYASLGFRPIAPYRHNPIAGTVFLERRLAAAGFDSVGSAKDPT